MCMKKRLFDIFFSSLGVVILFPLFVFIAICVKIDSKGPIFYTQKRVGKNNKDFNMLKFRSMKIGSDKYGLITAGINDPRITASGHYIRKFKFDELPQLFNVIKGDMSLVGPRPEVRKYVDMYNAEQQQVLSVRPGITDIASIHFRNENQLFDGADAPDYLYINEIMPKKLDLNREYIRNRSFFKDIKIILLTFKAIIKE